MRPRHLLVVLCAAVLAAACGADPASSRRGDEPPLQRAFHASPVAKEPPLPRGATQIFPDYRLVGYVGGRSEAFGRLLPGTFDDAIEKIESLGKQYDGDGKKIMPVFELITVIAHGSAAGGLYRTFEPDSVIQEYLDAAREHDAMLLLNVQPGRSDFIDDVRHLEKWLIEPDVGLALDPEWAVGPDEVPGGVYGSTTGDELDEVAAYVSDLVRKHDLPEKVMVFHQVHESVVDDEADLLRHQGVDVVKSVDGIGSRRDKESTWGRLMPPRSNAIGSGFKLFYDEDTELGPLMTPREVLALRPRPEYVMYE